MSSYKEPLLQPQNSLEDFNSINVGGFSSQQGGNMSKSDSIVDLNSFISAFAHTRRISFPREVNEVLEAGLKDNGRTNGITQGRGLQLAQFKDALEEMSVYSSSRRLELPKYNHHFQSAKSIQRIDSIIWADLCKEVDTHEKGQSIFIITNVYSPTSMFVLIWNTLVLLVDSIYSAFIVPIIVFFFVAEDDQFILGWTSLVAGMMFFVDLFMGFHQGLLVDTSHGKTGILLDGKAIAYQYVKSGRFWVNVVSAISLPLTFAAFFSNFGQQEFWIRSIFYCLQLVRMSRVAKVIKNIFREMYGYKHEFIGHSLSTNELFIFGIAYTALFYFNLAGCVWYATARIRGYENSWVSSLPNYTEDISKPRLYVASIYFIVVTVTSVGYGDIYPRGWQEELVCMFIIAAGSILFAMFLALCMDLLASYGNMAREAKAFRDKMVQVNCWMKANDLPLEIKKEVHTFYGIQHLKQKYHSDILNGLPGYIRNKITRHITRDLVASQDLFSHILRNDILDHICYRLTIKYGVPGEVLCLEGDESHCIWILQSGEISMTRWNHLVKIVRAPDTCGELSYLEDVVPACKHRQFALECISDCTIWQLSICDLRPMISQLSDYEQSTFVLNVYKTFDEALAHYHYEDEQMEKIKREVDNYIQRLKRGDSVFNFPRDVLFNQLTALNMKTPDEVDGLEDTASNDAPLTFRDGIVPKSETRPRPNSMG